jgi:hypothetical protein
MAIKAVILDFGGTLSDGALDWDPYHEKIRSILAGKGARAIVLNPSLFSSSSEITALILPMLII